MKGAILLFILIVVAVVVGSMITAYIANTMDEKAAGA